MDILVVANQEKIFKVDDGAGRALLAAFPDHFVWLNKPQTVAPAAAAPKVPTWSVIKGPRTERFYIRIALVGGGEVLFTDEESEMFKPMPTPFSESHLPKYGNWVCPVEVVKQYLALKARPVPFVGITEADKNKFAEQRRKMEGR